MAEPLEVPLDKLRELYVVQGLSIYAVAKFHLDVSYGTCQTWILKHRLEDEREKFIAESTARLKQQQNPASLNENVLIGEAMESASKPELRSGTYKTQPIYAPTPSAPLAIASGTAGTQISPDDEEEPSAFELLKTQAQKDFVLLYLKEKRKPRKERLTLQEMADKLGRSHSTIDEYLANPNVQQAIEEVTDPLFAFQAKQAKDDQILEELQSPTRARHEIIKHTSDLLGQTSNDLNINFNVQAKSPNLRNRFK